MKKLFLIGLMLLLFSCSENREENKGDLVATSEDSVEEVVEFRPINLDSLRKVKIAIHNSRLDFSKAEPLFEFSNIKTLDSNSIFNTQDFICLSEQEFYNAFQDSSLYYYDPKYNGVYYYSNQGEWKGFKRYIFVGIDEVCCEYYYYNIYDSSGKLTDSFVIEKSGGDGGWSIEGSVNMLDDSTIIKTTNDCESEDDEKGYTETCDSVITVYHLLNDGKIKAVKEFEKRTITKR